MVIEHHSLMDKIMLFGTHPMMGTTTFARPLSHVVQDLALLGNLISLPLVVFEGVDFTIFGHGLIHLKPQFHW